MGVQFDAPLARLLERNDFRAALINYQAARRQYYQVDDEISQSLRSILRLIEFAQVDFEVQRTSLRVAVAQVRSARLTIQKPPGIGPNTGLGPTASLDLINALGRLNDAQDAFIGVWVGYEVQRGLLDLQMGTMRLDEEGLWIDPGPIGPKLGYPSEEEMHEVPEYTHGFPSLDDLLYRARGDDPFGSEVVPTPSPDLNGPGGPGEELELPLELGDLTQNSARGARRITEPAVGAPAGSDIVQPASFSASLSRGSEEAPLPGDLADESSGNLPGQPPSARLEGVDFDSLGEKGGEERESQRNPLRQAGFHSEEAVRALGRKLRR